LVAILGSSAVPAAAFAADSNGLTIQIQPDTHRTGLGFDEHRQVIGNDEHVDVNVCSKIVAPDSAHCDARVRTDLKARSAQPARAGQAAAQAQPAGGVGNGGAYDPAFLRAAYNLNSLSVSGGTGQVVAVVDAMDDPKALSDLAYYRNYFGLPALPACTSWPSTSACFSKVDQNGGTNYPPADQGWAEEISLDLDMVSAICPNCTILLVEANSGTYSDLAAAVNQAATLGANAISNSYGGGEWSGETAMDSAYHHPGVAITASSGDGGYGVEYPAASPFVTAVGGTTLNQTTNSGGRNATETAWSGAGSGCSGYEPKPTWQKDASCANRTVSDVSAVADPNTGVWVYDTYVDPGFEVFGGTSVASPIIASIYALAGNSLSSGQQMDANPYAHASALFDITGGTNGSCSATYLCAGVAGYDGPTGLGTPNAAGAFTNPVTQPRADFSLSSASSALKITRGGASGTDTLTLSTLNGYNSSVRLSVSGLPSGVTAKFSANPLTRSGTSVFSIRAAGFTASGSYPLTIVATGADGTRHTLTVQLTVQ
jgi:subtilase family serine protease